MSSLSLRKLWIVARHEFDEAIASRLLAFVLLLYVAGAALSCGLFLSGFQAAEEQVRQTLATEMGLPLDEVPADLVREKAIPALINIVDDEQLRGVLLEMPPFAIFYTFVTLSSVALLVLAVSAGTHAADLASGSVRFSLVRCDRTNWVVGKFCGQGLVLLLGLGAGAAAAGSVGMWLDARFVPSTWTWLLRASLAAWVYGMAHGALFCALSLLTRTAMKARMLAFLALIGLAFGHWTVAASQQPALTWLRYAFPSEYKAGLWLNSASLGLSVAALGALAAACLAAGVALFSRRDA